MFPLRLVVSTLLNIILYGLTSGHFLAIDHFANLLYSMLQ